jgi:hypothetical protein
MYKKWNGKAHLDGGNENGNGMERGRKGRGTSF